MGVVRNDYKVGDLVRCIYDLFETQEYILIPDFLDGGVYYGIIVGLQEHVFSSSSIYDERLDTIYAVRCTDNEVRFFSFWEMTLLSSG